MVKGGTRNLDYGPFHVSIDRPSCETKTVV